VLLICTIHYCPTRTSRWRPSKTWHSELPDFLRPIGSAAIHKRRGDASFFLVRESQRHFRRCGEARPDLWHGVLGKMLSVMPEPAATIFAVAAFTGLRRGELQGLRWEDYQNGQIRVRRAIWEGHVSDPKTGTSKGAVPVIKQVADRLEFHQLRSGNPTNGPVFRNSKGGAVCLNNVLGRQILPALKRCECGKALPDHAEAKHDFKLDESFPKWRGWHAARRGLGSNLYALGITEKVIQQILRHANVSTTATYYIKTVPAQVTDAMEKLQDALPQSLAALEGSEQVQESMRKTLSDNELATEEWNAAASSAVN
jgi:integrase